MIKNHPKQHINQILSIFELEYPDEINVKSLGNLEKRKLLENKLINIFWTNIIY